jgi:hypothetical protein
MNETNQYWSSLPDGQGAKGSLAAMRRLIRLRTATAAAPSDDGPAITIFFEESLTMSERNLLRDEIGAQFEPRAPQVNTAPPRRRAQMNYCPNCEVAWAGERGTSCWYGGCVPQQEMNLPMTMGRGAL